MRTLKAGDKIIVKSEVWLYARNGQVVNCIGESGVVHKVEYFDGAVNGYVIIPDFSPQGSLFVKAYKLHLLNEWAAA